MATLKTDELQDRFRALLDRLLGDDPAEYADFETSPEDYFAKSGFDGVDLDDVEACMPAKYDVPAETRARYDDTHPHDAPTGSSSAAPGPAAPAVVREITMYRECLYPEAPYPEGDVIVDAGTDHRPQDRPDEGRYDPDEPVKDDEEAATLREEAALDKERGEKPDYDADVAPDRYEQREEADKLREEAIGKYEAGEDLTPEEKALVDEYYADPEEIDAEPPLTGPEYEDAKEALLKVEAGEELTKEEEELLARYQEAQGQEAAPPEVAEEPPMSPEELREGRQAAAKEGRGEELTNEEELAAERFRDYLKEAEEAPPVEVAEGPSMSPKEQLEGRQAAAREARGEELTKEEELLAERYRDYLREGQEAPPAEPEPPPPFSDPEELLAVRQATAKEAAGEELTKEEELLLERYKEYEETVQEAALIEEQEPAGYGPEYDPGLSPELRDALAKVDQGQDLTDEETQVVEEYYEEQKQAEAAEPADNGGTVGADPPPDAPPTDGPTNGGMEEKSPDYGAGNQDSDQPPTTPPGGAAGADGGGLGFDVDQVLEETIPEGLQEQILPIVEEVASVDFADDAGTDGLPDPEASEGAEVSEADPGEG